MLPGLGLGSESPGIKPEQYHHQSIPATGLLGTQNRPKLIFYFSSVHLGNSRASATFGDFSFPYFLP